jgi:hypothetical protein
MFTVVSCEQKLLSEIIHHIRVLHTDFVSYTVSAPFQFSPSCHRGIFKMIQVPRSAVKRLRDPSSYTTAQEYQADSITYLICLKIYSTVLFKRVESALIFAVTDMHAPWRCICMSSGFEHETQGGARDQQASAKLSRSSCNC